MLFSYNDLRKVTKLMANGTYKHGNVELCVAI